MSSIDSGMRTTGWGGGGVEGGGADRARRRAARRADFDVGGGTAGVVVRRKRVAEGGLLASLLGGRAFLVGGEGGVDALELLTWLMGVAMSEQGAVARRWCLWPGQMGCRRRTSHRLCPGVISPGGGGGAVILSGPGPGGARPTSPPD